MKDINENPGNDRSHNQDNTSENQNQQSKQEEQNHSDELQRKDSQNKQGNPASIKDLPSIDASTRDLGTISGVD